MHVFALLATDEQASRVKAALPRAFLMIASSVSGGRALLRQHGADLLVIGPVFAIHGRRTAHSEEELFGIAVERPYLPVVFYVSHPAKAVSLIARFPRLEACEAVVMGIDDDPRTLGAVVESLLLSSFVGRLLHCIFSTGDAPHALFDAFQQALLSPRRFDTVQAFADHANMSRRSLDRWFADRGLVTCAEFLQLTRALLAVRLIRDRPVGSDIFTACGLGGSESIRRFVTRAMGVPGDQLAACSDAELIGLFATRLRRVRGAPDDRVGVAEKAMIVGDPNRRI